MGGARQLLQEALVVMRSAVWGSTEALTVLALEFQHQPGVGVEGGDRHAMQQVKETQAALGT